MPRFDPTGEVATSFEKTPGKWLCKVSREVQVKKDGPKQPGVQTIDNRTQHIRRSASGHEMWDVIATVIDDHPLAPRSANILGIHLTWGGKARAAAYGFLAALGHPVEAWKRETDPSKVPEITPEMIYDRPFVLDMVVNEDGFLEPNGFMPYLAATAQRGPTSGRKKEAPKGAGAANGGGVGQANPALAAGGTKATGAAGDDGPLPF